VEGRTEATNALRRRIKNELEEQILDYYTNQGGQVVILDANNGNIANRKETYQKFESKGVHVIFLGTSPLCRKAVTAWREVADDRINM
jgi:6-phosphofructo-2-kinase/fructose-2,6-biphosphatase 4